jgi:DNA polymerase-3 subunit epsilon
MPKRLIVGGFDIETTGLLAPEHRIIEACVMKYEVDPAQPELNRLISCQTFRFNPHRSIDAKAFAVHKISLEMLKDEPLWEFAAKDLTAALRDCDIVVAHNGIEFDFPFLIQECERIGLSVPDFTPFDTMQDGRWATPFGKVPNLGELCFACGVDYDTDKAHAAEYDVGVMMKSFFFGWAQNFFKPIEDDAKSS